MNNWTESQYRVMTISAIATKLFIGLIVFIGIIKACVGDDIDPLDNSIMKAIEVVEHVDVVDSTHNGFRVVYVTAGSVTPERLKEISSREHIKAAFRQLQYDAPIHFKHNLLETDIYDFALFARNYQPDKAIQIHNIFIKGNKKCKLYVQHNPNIENCATYFDSRTEQGALYLNYGDINISCGSGKKVYRYWRCTGNNSQSNTDEQFSHFSKSEAIKN